MVTEIDVEESNEANRQANGQSLALARCFGE